MRLSCYEVYVADGTARHSLVAQIRLVRDTAPSLLPMVRAPGIHVSQLIGELQVQLGHYDPTDKDNIAAVFELGNALEHAIVERLALDDPDRYYRPAELSLDNITGTPDLFEMCGRGIRAQVRDNEIKCTWASTKHGPGSKKFWGYERQMLAYCHMAGLTGSTLHVCFLNGDYRWGAADWGPVWRTWEYDWTAMELETNWRMLLKQATRKQPTTKKK